MSMYEADLYMGRTLGRYLHRTSLLMRQQVGEDIPVSKNMVDRDLRIVLDGNGPRMVSADDTVASEQLRRVGNILYTRSFADAFLREILLSTCSLRSTLTRLQGQFQLSGNELGGLMPEHHKTMWGILEDILKNPSIQAWSEALRDRAHSHGEHRVLTCDGTMKVALGLKGYQRGWFRNSATQGNMAWSEEEMLSRIFTIRGTTGFLIAAVLIKDETPASIAAALAEAIPDPMHRECVEYVSVDWVTKGLYPSLQHVFPNIRCVCEDPKHVVMKVKSAWNHKPSPVSKCLDKIMSKFSKADCKVNDAASSPPWVWQDTHRLSKEEQDLLCHVHNCNLPADEITRSDTALAEDEPWTCYLDFLRSMAALSTQFASSMKRRVARKGTSVLRVLEAACDFPRWGHYYNNVHMRTFLTGGSSVLQPVGTTSNEALHAQLRSAFRQVYDIHAPVMQLRLHTFTLLKQVAFEAELRVPGLRQRREGEVLSRVLARPLLDADAWQHWCVTHSSGKRVGKAALPLRARRASHQLRVRAWKQQKGKAKATKKSTMKRTIFSRSRTLHLFGRH